MSLHHAIFCISATHSISHFTVVIIYAQRYVHLLISFILLHYEFEKNLIPQEEEQKLIFAKKLMQFGMSLPQYERILQEQEILPLS